MPGSPDFIIVTFIKTAAAAKRGNCATGCCRNTRQLLRIRRVPEDAFYRGV